MMVFRKLPGIHKKTISGSTFSNPLAAPPRKELGEKVGQQEQQLKDTEMLGG